MIRKTSLLHKTNPTARRSGFADMSIAAANIFRTTFAAENIRLQTMPGEGAPRVASSHKT